MEAGEALAAGIALAASGVPTALAAWRVAGRLIGPERLDRALAATVLWLGALCLALQALGIVGLLSRWPAALVLAAAGVAVLAQVPEVPGGEEPARASSAGILLAGLGAGVAVLALALGVQGHTTSFDTLQYHAPNAGTWLHAGSLLELPVAVPGYATNAYPSNHTLTGVWLMLVTGGDQLAYAVNFVWGLLALLAGAVLTRTLGGRAAVGGLVALGIVLTPICYGTQANSLMSDLAAAAGVTAAAAAALRSLHGDDARAWTVVAGLALGLAAGSKYTAFAPAAAVAAVPLIALRRRGLWRSGLMAVVAAPLIVFWLVRNAIEFGNPLYPLGLGPLEGSSGPIADLNTTIARHLAAGEGAIVRRWLDLIPDLLGFAALLPLAAAVAGVLALRRRDRRIAAGAGIAVVSLVAYLVTPATGGGPEGLQFLIGSQLRYALPALLVAAAVVAALASRRTWVVWAPLLGFGAVKLGEGYAAARPDLAVSAPVAAVALAAGAAAAALALRPQALPHMPVALTSAGAALLIAGATTVVLHGQDPQPPTATERVLAERCPGGTVAILQVSNLRAVMGRAFDVPVVAIDRPAPAGRLPILDAGQAERRIAELAPALVVEMPAPTQPPGWSGPAGWERGGAIGRARIHVAPRPVGCRPPRPALRRSLRRPPLRAAAAS